MQTGDSEQTNRNKAKYARVEENLKSGKNVAIACGSLLGSFTTAVSNDGV